MTIVRLTNKRRATQGIFPLSVASSGRYLQDALAAPFFVHGDACWSIEVQLTRTQIDTYLNDRQTKGFTALVFEAMEHYFSDNTPVWSNREGNTPFTDMADFSTTNESYWQLVDYIVAGAKARDMVCIINPAYAGWQGGSEGWNTTTQAQNATQLQNYGTFLANRYGSSGNVIWCLGGDYAGGTTVQDKQWNIVTGIRSVTPNALITAHGDRTESAYSQWNGYTGFNLNNIYTDGTEYGYAATEYARSPVMPFILFEGYYENYQGTYTAADCRRQAYTSLLSGACGHIYGNAPVWDFGSAASSTGGVTAALTHLSDTGTVQMGYVKELFTAYSWWLLQPKTDTSLVTGSLGTGTSRICPAKSSDSNFAMVWVPSSQSVTVNMATMAPSSVRVRLYNTTTGAFTTVAGSPFANSGTQSIATGGERIVVLDAA